VFSLALFYLKASRIFDGTCTFAYPWKYLWKKLANNFKPIKRENFINYLQGSIKFLYLPLRSITYRVSTKSKKYYRLFSVLSSTWAIFLIFYLKTFCILLVNYSHMKEMLAYQFLCHTHMFFFFVFLLCVRVSWFAYFWYFYPVCSRFFHNISKRIASLTLQSAPTFTFSTFGAKCRWKSQILPNLWGSLSYKASCILMCVRMPF